MDSRGKKALEEFQKIWKIEQGTDWTIVGKKAQQAELQKAQQAELQKAQQAEIQQAQQAVVRQAQQALVKQTQQGLVIGSTSAQPKALGTFNSAPPKALSTNTFPAATLTYADTITKNSAWYNTAMRQSHPEIYYSFNQIWILAQQAGVRNIGYHLSNIEKIMSNLIQENKTITQQLQIELEGFQKTKIQFNNMIKESELTTTDEQYKKKSILVKGNSSEEQVLSMMLIDLELADTLKIKLSDIGNLVDTFKPQGAKAERLQAELNLTEIMKLYSQNQLQTENIIDILHRLQKDDIIDLFKNEKQLILNKEKKPRFLVAPHSIQRYKQAIQKGIVSELWISTGSQRIEEYKEILPGVCCLAISQLDTSFSSTFKFQIYSIWEERQYQKLFRSFQIWVLSLPQDIPHYEFISGEQLQLNIDEERFAAAKEFFKFLWINYDDFSTILISEDGSILLFTNLLGNNPQKKIKKEVFQSIIDENNFGPIATEARDIFMEENTNIITEYWLNRSPADQDLIGDLANNED